MVVTVGGGCIIHAGGGGGRTHRFGQTALMCNWRRPAATSSRRASFSALASANSFVYFCIERSNITLTHLHVNNCRVRQLQFSGIFVALGFVGNGKWLTAHDRQTMMQITRAEIIAATLPYINLWPFRPLLWILQSGCQPDARTDHNQRARQWSPDIAATVDCLTDITTINHR